MSNFPSIPLQGTDKNSKLFLDMLAGRMGAEKRVITLGDLIDTGIIELASGITVDDLDPQNPSDGVNVPGTSLPDNPSKPTQLTVVGSWGALFLTWEYDAYNDEYGTEIWRSSTNDVATANLIAVSTGRTYTDNVGEKETYFYWVRNRSISNVVSGYNQTNGVSASSNLITTAEDFVMANPDAEFVPFTIVNYGTVPSPDWKILLNGSVIITSDLSIGQLITGEMASDVTFTIGNGSVQLGTDGSGKGYMIVTGDDGIPENDYLYLNAGVLKTYVYNEDTSEHELYKTLRHFEQGTAQDGQTTVIPGYFKSAPQVNISFNSMSVYNSDPSYSSQDQSILLSVGEVTQVSGKVGSWEFTPTAKLVLADGVQTEVEAYDTYTSSNSASYTASTHEFVGAEAITVNFTVGSAKVTASGDYQNRRITCYVDGQLNGAGGFSQIGTNSVDVAGDGIDATCIVEIDDATLTDGDWELQYRFVAADRTGTTPSGDPAYEYEDDNSTSGALTTIQTTAATITVSGDAVNTRPSRSSTWELYKVDYEFSYDYTIRAWRLLTDAYWGTYSRGHAEYTVPDSPANDSDEVYSYGLGSDEAYCNCDAFPYNDPDSTLHEVTGSTTAGTNGIHTLSTPDDPLFLAGKYSNSSIQLEGSHNGDLCTGGEYKGHGQAIIEITAYDVTYYYRKAITYSTTPNNHFKIDSIIANLGATDISIDTAVLTYLAIGE